MTEMEARANETLSIDEHADDRALDRSLRPARFEDFVGQERIKDNLRVFVEAARRRGDPIDHTLFCGPPGLGKTTLALILAGERGVTLHSASGPAIEHNLTATVEENLYTAVEDFRIDIVNGDGPYAQTLQLPLNPFTLVGATTRTGLLTNPMLSRFGYVARLDYYPDDALQAIIERSARLLNFTITTEAAQELARRSRGTPRISNRLLRRSRDFAEVLSDGKLDAETAREGLARLDVDGAGLDQMDRRYLTVIIDHYDGGPVGIETLAAALSEPRDTLEDVYEPYLLQRGLLARTARGRVATRHAFEHLGKKQPTGKQSGLF